MILGKSNFLKELSFFLKITKDERFSTLDCINHVMRKKVYTPWENLQHMAKSRKDTQTCVKQNPGAAENQAPQAMVPGLLSTLCSMQCPQASEVRPQRCLFGISTEAKLEQAVPECQRRGKRGPARSAPCSACEGDADEW